MSASKDRGDDKTRAETTHQIPNPRSIPLGGTTLAAATAGGLAMRPQGAVAQAQPSAQRPNILIWGDDV